MCSPLDVELSTSIFIVHCFAWLTLNRCMASCSQHNETPVRSDPRKHVTGPHCKAPLAHCTAGDAFSRAGAIQRHTWEFLCSQ